MTDEKVPQFVVPSPGAPLYSWDIEDSRIQMQFSMLLEQTDSETAVQKLVRGDESTVEDMVAFGHLNFAAFIGGFEPVVALWNGSAKLDPRILEWLSKEA